MKKQTIPILFLLAISFQSFAQIAYLSFYTGGIGGTFNNRNISLKPVGMTPGAAGVSVTGAATYTIPIWCPQGTNRMTPQIALTYNSQGGNGLAGMGWNISGLSAITRVNNDIIHDGEVTPVYYDGRDKFALDGTRLVLKNGNYGANGSEYALETEDFSNTTYYQNGSTDYFSVRKKDGMLYEYGNVDSYNDDACLRKTSGNSPVMIWNLRKITDANGNSIEFSYFKEGRRLAIYEIRYTRNDNQNLLPYYKIQFNTTYGRIDENNVYVGGSAINSGLILESIVVEDEYDNPIKIYQMRYANDGISSYLIDVTEKNQNNVELNSIQFKYGDTPTSFSTETSPIGITNSGSDAVDIYVADYSGDGKDDIMLGHKTYTNNIWHHDELTVIEPIDQNSFYQHFNTSLSTNYTKIEKMDVPNSHAFISDDFNGDGKKDIMITHFHLSGNTRIFDNIQIYLGSGNGSFPSTPNHTKIPPTNFTIVPTNYEFVLPGDFDGDGSSDFITILSNTTGYQAFFTSIRKGIDNANIDPLAIANNPPSNAWVDFANTANKIEVIDFNGDGKMELFIVQGATSYVLGLEWQGTTIVGVKKWEAGYPTQWHTYLYFADFNGDRITDFLSGSAGGQWEIARGTGTGYSVSNFNFNTYPTISQNPTYTDDRIMVADFNGDSKSDIVHIKSNSSNNTTYFNLYYSKGNSFYSEQHTWAKFIFTGLDARIYCADINGDGRADIVRKGIYSDPLEFLYFKPYSKKHLLDKVADCVGNETTFNYELLNKSTSYTKGNSAQYPLFDLKAPLYIVRTQSDLGAGSTTTNYFSYAEAIGCHQGRGFLGFKKFISQGPSNIKTESISDINLSHYVPYAKEAKAYNVASNQQISHTTNNIAFVQGTVAGTFYQQLLSQTQTDLLSGATSTTTNTYDNINFGTVVSSTTDINGIESTTTQATYTQAGYVTNPSLPDLVTVTRTRNGQTTATDKIKFFYDGAGRVSNRIDKYQTPYYVSNLYQYNGFGNVIEDKKLNILQTSPNPNTITDNYTYDSKGRFVESATNPLGQTSYTTWHSVWGKPLTTTGIDDLVTTYTYDNWGKLTSTKVKTGLPEEETVTYSDGWDLNWIQAYYTLVSHPNKPDVKTWYDKLGRAIKSQTEHLNGHWTESTKTYDVLGHVWQETSPRLITEPVFTTTYDFSDPHNRLTSVTNNLGTTNYSYSFLGSGKSKVTITDAGGQNKSTTTDATGKIVETEDNGGKLFYTYDSRGNSLAVKLSLSTILSHSYNSFGVKTNTYDVSAGITTYVYDAFGRLKSEKDAKSQTHTFRYNELGLLTQRTGPEGTTYLSYYGDGNGYANQIATVSGFNGVSENYYYDNLGRLTQKDKVIEGHSYSTSYTYDNNDNLTKKEYGDGFYINYNYTNGFLNSVVQPLQHLLPIHITPSFLFTSNSINGQGQATSYSLINGLTTTNTYDNSFLTRTTTPGIQDLEMTYDFTTSNLNQRNDHIKSLKEDFSYDNLQRLTQSVVNDYGNQALKPALGVTYDVSPNGTSRGNILTKSDAGSFGVSFTAKTLSAKNENSLISQNVQDITYTPYRKTETVKEISLNSNEYIQSFMYDAGYNRVKTEVTENGVPVLTRHYLDDYEVNIDPNTQSKTYIHYIAGGDGLCAIAEVQNQFYPINNNVTYHAVYKDHLGSIVTATSQYGTIEAEQNFDAWGIERNAQDWTYNNVGGVGLANSWLYRGYTGQEHMPHFSIINMNGRMYDPVLGRMMSPDPYIMLEGTQGYNRYSYCLNNPLKYTDPSGNFLKMAMFGIGMLADYLSNLSTGQHDPLGNAYRNVSSGIDGMSNCMQFKIYSDENTLVTAGLDPFSIGLSANYYQKAGDWNLNANVGVGYFSGPNAGAGVGYSIGDFSIGIGGSTNFSSYSFSGGGSYNDGRFSAGYYQTYYGGSNGDAALNQWSGGFSVGLNGMKFREENDFLAFGHSSDKGRTQAWEFSYGNLAIGSFIQTNDPKGGPTENTASPHWGLNRTKYDSWVNGQVLMAPVYLGYNSGNSSSRIGYSTWQVQDLQQNGMHQSFFTPGNQNYYLNYNNLYTGGYFLTGYNNPYSLYGF